MAFGIVSAISTRRLGGRRHLRRAALNMFGEVFICEFPFTSGLKSKIRPALVLFDLHHDAIICRLTSVSHSNLLDVRLADWRQAGLLKPSVARLGRLVTAEKSIFV